MRTLIYGRHPVYETLKAGRRQVFHLQILDTIQPKGVIQEIISLAHWRKIPVELVSRATLDARQAGNQGVLLVASEYPYVDLQQIVARAAQAETPPVFLLLDALQDPQNLGVLFRTAEAVGVQGVVMPRHQQAEITPAVVNASSGAVEHLWIAQGNLAQAIEKLKEAGVWVVGLEGSPEARLPNEVRLDGAIALVVGSEGEGLRRLVRDSCDILLRLPMRGKIQSLNAAAAGSVALYLAWQARGYL